MGISPKFAKPWAVGNRRFRRFISKPTRPTALRISESIKQNFQVYQAFPFQSRPFSYSTKEPESSDSSIYFHTRGWIEWRFLSLLCTFENSTECGKMSFDSDSFQDSQKIYWYRSNTPYSFAIDHRHLILAYCCGKFLFTKRYEVSLTEFIELHGIKKLTLVEKLQLDRFEVFLLLRAKTHKSEKA